MPRKSRTSSVVRNVALCYIRKSWTKDEKDSISPERQRTHIKSVCDTHGWQVEWYEDVEGHRSGMTEKNRPGWLALKSRLDDPDVIALVANDLSRLHRKGWRVGDLLDFVDQHGINLVLADPSRQIDFSTLQGKLFAQLSVFFDEWYAADISVRQKSDIAHRKSKGITVGLPPFGTKRNKQTGYLVPSDEGAWLLPDGTWVTGRIGEQPPVEDAMWRGYYECAERILRLYAEQKKRGNICAKMQEEGWAFRDRQGQPSMLEVDDIRRVVANWAEYGGYVSKMRARERHPSEYPVAEIVALLNPERAVFDIELLARVAHSRQERAYGKHPTNSVNVKARAYLLSGITYCARCEQMAERNKDARFRSLLSGHIGKYYRHKLGAGCGCSKKSVLCEVYEGQFVKLIKALEVTPESVELMTNLAQQMQFIGQEEKDLEEERAKAIALCNRRIQAAIDLYGDGRVSREEYLRRVERNEREIISWQARSNDTEKLAMELSMCVQAFETINKLWAASEDEDKQGMARHLFESITYDLDMQQIVDFRLKPWAEQFLRLRTGLYFSEDYNENPLTPMGL